MRSPLISYSSEIELKRALAVTPIDNENFNILLNKGLPPIVSATAFGAILGINPKLITAIARFPDRYYRTFTIPKKSGGERTILAPRTFLKTIQQYVRREILEKTEISQYVTGFVAGRGIVNNGLIHRGAKYLLNVDLRDFFGSVREQHVRQLFENLGFTPSVARLLMAICTFGGVLPQGAPTSPALSNLVFANADRDIAQICTSQGLLYSRYADDLTFSGDRPISADFLANLQPLLSNHGFTINAAKTRFSKPGQAKYVTGLVVNEKVHPPRQLRRKLRAMFHQAELKPKSFSDQSSILVGWASFVNSYDAQLGIEYLRIARAIRAR